MYSYNINASGLLTSFLLLLVLYIYIIVVFKFKITTYPQYYIPPDNGILKTVTQNQVEST